MSQAVQANRCLFRGKTKIKQDHELQFLKLNEQHEEQFSKLNQNYEKRIAKLNDNHKETVLELKHAFENEAANLYMLILFLVVVALLVVIIVFLVNSKRHQQLEVKNETLQGGVTLNLNALGTK